MIGGLELIREQCRRPADAVRWACVLEATSPKAGNVFPGREFGDLSYLDFVTAAEISAASFDPPPPSFSHGVLQASRETAGRLSTNVNLGILLLLGPLVQADSIDSSRRLNRPEWQSRVGDVLESTTPEDAKRLYAAINVASPGGMGESEEMDLSGPPPQNFLDAMRAAQSRDRIARNYAQRFSDLFETVVPMLGQSIQNENDLLGGIALAHLRLIASEPDSLIARKFGSEVAREVQQRANFDVRDAAKREAFDRFLRIGTRGPSGKSSTLNPGTTADLIAAGLYVLLREHDQTECENQTGSSV